jgi:zinc D-Ala-D-Ala carboxypeptidase
MSHKPTHQMLILFVLAPLMLLLYCGQHPNRSSAHATSENGGSAPYNTNLVDQHDSLIDKNYLLGKFNPAAHPLFCSISPKLTSLQGAWLRKEVHEAFLAMQTAAAKDGIPLMIVSATRNFDAQKVIWEAKWKGVRKVDGIDLSTIPDPYERARRILKYSSMPGTSRHHWGTDIDINSVEPEYFRKGKGVAVYAWLKKNAPTYGFCQTYTKKGIHRPTGYEEEAWHWSFTPVSSGLLARYTETIQAADLTGFQGCDVVDSLHIIRDYVSGINPRCR